MARTPPKQNERLAGAWRFNASARLTCEPLFTKDSTKVSTGLFGKNLKNSVRGTVRSAGKVAAAGEDKAQGQTRGLGNANAGAGGQG
jgi:hypothetical protein